MQHYIFGYGSLICSTSRSKTVSLSGTVLPVQVSGLQTIWSVRAEAAGWTPLGVSFQPKARAYGVLLSVEGDDLEKLDERELGYCRTALELDKVRTIPFLDQKLHYCNNDDPLLRFLMSGQSKTLPNVKLWVYVPEIYLPSTAEFPIPQSYLDVILRGCMELSPQLAVEFLKHTNVVGENPGFVDDRSNHLYPRGDYEWSQQNADLVDSLIHEHRPDLMAIRKSLSI